MSNRAASPEFSRDYETMQAMRRRSPPSTGDTVATDYSNHTFWDDWPAEDYDEAVAECLDELRDYLPKRNMSSSYRRSAKNALEQARYLCLGSRQACRGSHT